MSRRRISHSNPSSSSSALPNAFHPLETEILKGLNKSETSTQELAIKTLLDTIIGNKDNAVSLCTSIIVLSLIPLLTSCHRDIQIGLTTSVLEFSKMESNRAKLVRWGIVPPLLNVLKTGLSEARANAVISIHYLTIQTQNRADIGAAGAIPPLLENFFENPTQGMRKESGLALYYLSICSENLKILENLGAVPKLLGVAIDNSSKEAVSLQWIAMAIMYSLADTSKGLREMMDFRVVEEMLRMVRDGEGRDGNCLSLLNRICKWDPSRFRLIAMAAGGEEVLTSVKEEWGIVDREQAMRMLEIIRTKPNRDRFETKLSEIKEEDEEEKEEDQSSSNNKGQKRRRCCDWFKALFPRVAQYIPFLGHDDD